jgi:hypothetical protein
MMVEAVGRLVWGVEVRVDDRVLFFSPGAWRADPAGAIRYAPDREIRTAALYGSRVEYDVRFTTNDLGFIDVRDYGTRATRERAGGIAIVGDSFTAGFHGGNPWVPRLAERARRARPAARVYNLGVGATGIGDFRRLLKSVQGQIEFDRIAIVLISDDVTRPQWRPLEHEGRLHLCRVEDAPSKCASSRSRILLFDDVAQGPGGACRAGDRERAGRRTR